MTVSWTVGATTGIPDAGLGRLTTRVAGAAPAIELVQLVNDLGSDITITAIEGTRAGATSRPGRLLQFRDDLAPSLPHVVAASNSYGFVFNTVGLVDANVTEPGQHFGYITITYDVASGPTDQTITLFVQQTLTDNTLTLPTLTMEQLVEDAMLLRTNWGGFAGTHSLHPDINSGGHILRWTNYVEPVLDWLAAAHPNVRLFWWMPFGNTDGGDLDFDQWNKIVALGDSINWSTWDQVVLAVNEHPDVKEMLVYNGTNSNATDQATLLSLDEDWAAWLPYCLKAVTPFFKLSKLRYLGLDATTVATPSGTNPQKEIGEARYEFDAYCKALLELQGGRAMTEPRLIAARDYKPVNGWGLAALFDFFQFTDPNGSLTASFGDRLTNESFNDADVMFWITGGPGEGGAYELGYVAGMLANFITQGKRAGHPRLWQGAPQLTSTFIATYTPTDLLNAVNTALAEVAA